MTRIRVRSLMIAVAVIALLFGRPANLRNRERYHRKEVISIKLSDLELYLLLTDASPGGQMHPKSGHPIAQAAEPVRSFIRYHYEMASKYALASRKPWLPVEADPPAPRKPSPEEVGRFVTLNSKI